MSATAAPQTADNKTIALWWHVLSNMRDLTNHSLKQGDRDYPALYWLYIRECATTGTSPTMQQWQQARQGTATTQSDMIIDGMRLKDLHTVYTVVNLAAFSDDDDVNCHLQYIEDCIDENAWPSYDEFVAAHQCQ